jgi:hypothetical protein
MNTFFKSVGPNEDYIVSWSLSLSLSIGSKANEIKEHMWRTHGEF